MDTNELDASIVENLADLDAIGARVDAVADHAVDAVAALTFVPNADISARTKSSTGAEGGRR